MKSIYDVIISPVITEQKYDGYCRGQVYFPCG